MSQGQSNNSSNVGEELGFDGDAATAIQNVAQSLSEGDDMTEGDAPAEEIPEDEPTDEEEEDKPDEYDGGINEEAIAHFKAEIEALKLMLEKKKKECERIFLELAEFAAIFPKRAIESIPAEVWESMRRGVPLSAAYALYEKQREADENNIREVNRINAERSAGAISSGADGGYYSPEEVRKMTANEVKKNYNLIIESMKKWN